MVADGLEEFAEVRPAVSDRKPVELTRPTGGHRFGDIAAGYIHLTEPASFPPVVGASRSRSAQGLYVGNASRPRSAFTAARIIRREVADRSGKHSISRARSASRGAVERVGPALFCDSRAQEWAKGSGGVSLTNLLPWCCGELATGSIPGASIGNSLRLFVSRWLMTHSSLMPRKHFRHSAALANLATTPHPSATAAHSPISLPP
jgi:hypothetical protein